MHNSIRADPKSFVPVLQRYLKFFNDPDNPTVYFVPDCEPVMLQEGPKALKEAVSFLKKAKAVKAKVKRNPALMAAAQQHADDLAKSNARGHKGSDGSTFQTRIETHCKWGGAIYESIAYGGTEPEKLLCDLLADDGIAKRSH